MTLSPCPIGLTSSIIIDKFDVIPPIEANSPNSNPFLNLSGLTAIPELIYRFTILSNGESAAYT